MKAGNANCSFCRKSYRDVGPLVEGPGDVYICRECVELCQAILIIRDLGFGVTRVLFVVGGAFADLKAETGITKLDRHPEQTIAVDAIELEPALARHVRLAFACARIGRGGLDTAHIVRRFRASHRW